MFTKMKISSLISLMLLTYSALVFPVVVHFVFTEGCKLLEWQILSMSSCSMTMMVIVDWVSLSFSNVVCMISGCVMLFSSSYMSGDKFINRFTWIVFLFVLSMNFLIFIPSLPALLLGWDGLGIVSFALVIYYQNNKSLGAGLLTILMNRVGDVMILLAIGLMVLQGHWVITLMWDFYFSSFVVICLILAGMTKSAQIPFSAWLPAAMAAPTPVSALVHSSTLVTAGVYLIIRFHFFLSQYHWFNSGLLFLSVMTMLMAGIGATFENDLKKIIALSTLSQLSVMMLSLSLNKVELSLFHLYTHAMFKALLFLCAGAVIHCSSGNQDLRKMGSVSAQMPLTVTCMNVANLCLCGAPFLSGFYSKDLILQVCLMDSLSFFMLVMIFLATSFTMAYSWRLAFSCLWNPANCDTLHFKQEVDIYVNLSSTILAVSAVCSGFMLQMIFVDFEVTILIFGNIPYIMMMVVVSGLFVGYAMCESHHSEKSPKKYLSFLSLMWFLAPLSTQPLVKFSMVNSSIMLKTIEFGWMEIIGGGGALAVSKVITQLNQYWQMKIFNILVMGSFFMAILILIFGL